MPVPFFREFCRMTTLRPMHYGREEEGQIITRCRKRGSRTKRIISYPAVGVWDNNDDYFDSDSTDGIHESRRCPRKIAGSIGRWEPFNKTSERKFRYTPKVNLGGIPVR